ncbi:hypothetical protein ISCGN_018335 [Ixodes scapularis]
MDRGRRSGTAPSSVHFVDGGRAAAARPSSGLIGLLLPTAEDAFRIMTHGRAANRVMRLRASSARADCAACLDEGSMAAVDSLHRRRPLSTARNYVGLWALPSWSAVSAQGGWRVNGAWVGARPTSTSGPDMLETEGNKISCGTVSRRVTARLAHAQE